MLTDCVSGKILVIVKDVPASIAGVYVRVPPVLQSAPVATGLSVIVYADGGSVVGTPSESVYMT